ncbi:hypothetical protein PMZ80_000005 [Knufia obscura]|uniref:alpha-1,2-Mannosidase n=2 Tax=Knufia TaxID=430999 RepID=A0AAN8I2J7_9EURO|nr:hypothetical protein PMZ80_000005 [Knufia obscura]KAK5948814.1 hypothetical protein OHC33_010238 [Knufia fluminis]
MLLIRRLWLLPAIAVTLVLYYLYSYSLPSLRPLDRAARLQSRPERYPVKTYAQLPTGTALKLPKIQHDFSTETEDEKIQRLKRQDAVKEAFIHSWKGYKQYAWKQDEIAPLSGAYRNPFGGWGASLVDTMDTLWIMGLNEEFEECVAVVKDIDFTTNTEDVVNVFETTIRYLGGFLSAYDVSKARYPALLAKAVELADILYIAFDTPNRLPRMRWRWRSSVAGMPLQASKTTLLAEIGSMSVEFTRLAQLTGDAKWFDAIDRITDLFYKAQDETKIPGLWPTIIDAENAQFTENHFTLGGMADSTSEYLPKQYMLLGGLDDRYKAMYHKLVTAAQKYLFYRPLVPGNLNILFSGNAALDKNDKVVTELQGQHLTCFTSGMMGIAAKVFDRPDEMRVAKQLVDGCVWAYNYTPTGLMPETFHVASCHVGTDVPSGDACDWSESKWFEAVARQHGPHAAIPGKSLAESGQALVDQYSLLPGFTEWGDNRYILRPEAIESVFIMYRLTGDRTYLDTAWTMWDSISKACKTPIAYAGISDVRMQPPAQSDRMESFWLAETLKYFYLIFAEPTDWTLDDWVLNTEAHLLRRPKAGETLSSPSG